MPDVLRYHHLIHGYFCIYKRNHPLGFDKISYCHLNHSMFWLSIQFNSIKNHKNPDHLLFRDEVQVRLFIDVSVGPHVVLIINYNKYTSENG